MRSTSNLPPQNDYRGGFQEISCGCRGVCFAFQQGMCKRNKCRFAHDFSALRDADDEDAEEPNFA